MKTNKRLISIPDFMIALKAINDNAELSVTDLHHETRITYAHLHVLKQLFVQKGWVSIVEEGVKHLLSVTEKGKSIVEGIDLLLNRLDIDKSSLIKFRARTKHHWKEKEERETPVVEEKVEEENYIKTYPGVQLSEPVVEEPVVEEPVVEEPVVEEPVVEEPLTPPERIEAEQLIEEPEEEEPEEEEEIKEVITEEPVVEDDDEIIDDDYVFDDEDDLDEEEVIEEDSDDEENVFRTEEDVFKNDQ